MTFGYGFNLRDASEPLRLIAPRRPRGPVTEYVARLKLALAGLAEFPQNFTKLSARGRAGDAPVAQVDRALLSEG